MSRLSLLLVLLVVLTAGCNGISSGSSAPDRDPYGVDDPLESSLANPGENVAGLTEAGFQNDTFVRDHHAVLENRSYATTQTTTATLANGTTVFEGHVSTLYDRRHNQMLQTERTRGSWELNTDGSDLEERTTQLWVDEETETRISRIEHENGSVEFDTGPPRYSRATVYSAVSPLREAAEIAIERETYADGRYTVVTGTEPAADSTFLEDEPFSARAFIRDDGVVRYAAINVTIRRDGERVHVDQNYLVEDIGEVSANRPDWYEEAKEELEREEQRERTPKAETETEIED
ncbi:hypothetical protein [Halomontanus rarus]|uniref:hypothetical protein n=1 Tax=Halomontanus rarus TaxID=3034020 RepID=UPI0023E8CD13|nr:hypothetical protein [Halovivax sp. TS33]